MTKQGRLNCSFCEFVKFISKKGSLNAISPNEYPMIFQKYDLQKLMSLDPEQLSPSNYGRIKLFVTQVALNCERLNVAETQALAYLYYLMLRNKHLVSKKVTPMLDSRRVNGLAVMLASESDAFARETYVVRTSDPLLLIEVLSGEEERSIQCLLNAAAAPTEVANIYKQCQVCMELALVFGASPASFPLLLDIAVNKTINVDKLKNIISAIWATIERFDLISSLNRRSEHHSSLPSASTPSDPATSSTTGATASSSSAPSIQTNTLDAENSESTEETCVDVFDVEEEY